MNNKDSWPFMSLKAFARLSLNVRTVFGDMHSVVVHTSSGTINAIMLVSRTVDVMKESGEVVHGAKVNLWMEN
jgi:hypothetical protein